MYATEPAWVWIVFYSIMIVSGAASVFAIFTKRLVWMSAFHLFVIPSVYVTFVLHALGRQDGMTEFDWLWHDLSKGEIWSAYVTAGYAYTIVWWGMLIKEMRRR